MVWFHLRNSFLRFGNGPDGPELISARALEASDSLSHEDGYQSSVILGSTELSHDTTLVRNMLPHPLVFFQSRRRPLL